MDSVRQLIRYVMRGFYDVRSILIIDALLIHIVLTDEEVVRLLGMKSIKEVRALCQKLKEHHLLEIHIQKEEIPGQRAQSKTYYYIHNTETIDAIKWKMYSMKTMLEEQMGEQAQPHGYICDVCKSKYNSIDIIDSFSQDLGGFICGLCGNLLREQDMNSETYAGQEKLGKMMNQINPIIETLKIIDESVIPENTFESSLAVALPVPKTDEFGSTVGIKDRGKFHNSHGLAVASNKNGVPNSTLQINITSDAETAALEKKQREEKARLAEENALPTWHVESTVGKGLYDSTSNTQKESSSSLGSSAKPSGSGSATTSTGAGTTETPSEEVTEDDNNQTNEETLAAFYAQMAAKQKEEDEEEEEEEDEEEEDDEAEEDSHDEDEEGMEAVDSAVDSAAHTSAMESNHVSGEEEDDEEDDFEEV